MNIYKLSQTAVDGYDTYDSCVVAAVSAYAARRIHPSQYVDRTWWLEDNHYPCWATKLEDVKVELIGKAKAGIPAGIIVASFNAG
jgi:hypothetical protein